MSHCSKFIPLILLLVVIQSLGAENKVTVEDIVKHHLDSIADPATRAAMKSRVVEGDVTYRILVSGSGSIQGKAFLVSDTDKLQMRLKINAPQFIGERFVRDGDKVDIARNYADKTRSEFGYFLDGNGLPLREGLLGGVLTTGWPLLDLNVHKGKLRYDGLKKVEGKELYAVVYQPSKSNIMEVTLFFEPETFHHVMTVYSVTEHAGLGQGRDITGDPSGPVPGSASEQMSARQQQSRYRIEERFSDFKTADGVTLPSHYDLRYQLELQSGFTKLIEWDVKTTRVLNNVSVDARNFQVQ